MTLDTKVFTNCNDLYSESNVAQTQGQTVYCLLQILRTISRHTISNISHHVKLQWYQFHKSHNTPVQYPTLEQKYARVAKYFVLWDMG